MKLSELEEQAKKLREKHGDIEVKTQSLTHTWEPKLIVKGEGERKYILIDF